MRRGLTARQLRYSVWPSTQAVHAVAAKEGSSRALVKGSFCSVWHSPRPLFALIIHGTAQISFQRQPPGGQLLLQHHRLCEALDDALHRRQIVRDQ